MGAFFGKNFKYALSFPISSAPKGEEEKLLLLKHLRSGHLSFIK